MTPAAFFQESWGKRWTKTSGPRERFGSVFTPSELGTNALGDVGPGGLGAMSYRATYYDENGVARTFGAPLEMAEHLLATGMTIQFTELETNLPRIKQLATDVGAAFASLAPITVSCFLSPADHGFPWHLDNPHVFALQIEGSKRWRLGRTNVAAAPFTMEASGPRAENTIAFLRQLGMKIEPPSDDDCDEVVLEPGDVLYMPPGTWHRASALGSSCHLSILIRPTAFGRVLRTVVAALGMRFETWRTDLARMPAASLHTFVAARLAELQREVSSMTPEQLVRALELLASSPLARNTLLERARDTL